MHEKLATWKAYKKHLNQKCANLVICFIAFSYAFKNSQPGKHVKQCVGYYLEKMEFSQSPKDVHMHVKFAQNG